MNLIDSLKNKSNNAKSSSKRQKKRRQSLSSSSSSSSSSDSSISSISLDSNRVNYDDIEEIENDNLIEDPDQSESSTLTPSSTTDPSTNIKTPIYRFNPKTGVSMKKTKHKAKSKTSTSTPHSSLNKSKSHSKPAKQQQSKIRQKVKEYCSKREKCYCDRSSSKYYNLWCEYCRLKKKFCQMCLNRGEKEKHMTKFFRSLFEDNLEGLQKLMRQSCKLNLGLVLIMIILILILFQYWVTNGKQNYIPRLII